MTEKTKVGPRDFMESIPVFKFPPIPTSNYMVVYQGPDNPDFIYAEPVDFTAVCEWTEEDETYEGICFVVLDNDGGGFFDILCPDNIKRGCSNRLGIVRTDTLYWYDSKLKTEKPIYRWDGVRQAYVHPVAGTVKE